MYKKKLYNLIHFVTFRYLMELYRISIFFRCNTFCDILFAPFQFFLPNGSSSVQTQSKCYGGKVKANIKLTDARTNLQDNSKFKYLFRIYFSALCCITSLLAQINIRQFGSLFLLCSPCRLHIYILNCLNQNPKA